MKQTIIFLLAVTTGLVSCDRFQRDHTLDFLPGMYVRPIDHEYAIGSDTLEVKYLQQNTYQVIKRSGFRRMCNGRKLPREHKVEAWTGTYDEAEQVIHLSRRDKVLSPLPKENKLLLGTSAYKKIKR